MHIDVFVNEFEQALRVLALLPGAGTSYPQAGVSGLRRIYVPKVECHLYYTFDNNQSSSAHSGAPAENAGLD
jgi:hypothetical protein